jgi:hypothetical protein
MMGMEQNYQDGEIGQSMMNLCLVDKDIRGTYIRWRDAADESLSVAMDMLGEAYELRGVNDRAASGLARVVKQRLELHKEQIAVAGCWEKQSDVVCQVIEQLEFAKRGVEAVSCWVEG